MQMLAGNIYYQCRCPTLSFPVSSSQTETKIAPRTFDTPNDIFPTLVGEILELIPNPISQLINQSMTDPHLRHPQLVSEKLPEVPISSFCPCNLLFFHFASISPTRWTMD